MKSHLACINFLLTLQSFRACGKIQSLLANLGFGIISRLYLNIEFKYIDADVAQTVEQSPCK